MSCLDSYQLEIVLRFIECSNDVLSSADVERIHDHMEQQFGIGTPWMQMREIRSEIEKTISGVGS